MYSSSLIWMERVTNSEAQPLYISCPCFEKFSVMFIKHWSFIFLYESWYYFWKNFFFLRNQAHYIEQKLRKVLNLNFTWKNFFFEPRTTCCWFSQKLLAIWMAFAFFFCLNSNLVELTFLSSESLKSLLLASHLSYEWCHFFCNVQLLFVITLAGCHMFFILVYLKMLRTPSCSFVIQRADLSLRRKCKVGQKTQDISLKNQVKLFFALIPTKLP